MFINNCSDFANADCVAGFGAIAVCAVYCRVFILNALVVKRY